MVFEPFQWVLRELSAPLALRKLVLFSPRQAHSAQLWFLRLAYRCQKSHRFHSEYRLRLQHHSNLFRESIGFSCHLPILVQISSTVLKLNLIK